jgi:light-regulated signal transduction histidine kinase (bacteriophytochrome)
MNLVKESGARIYEQLNSHMEYVITFTNQYAATLIAEADKEAASKITLTQWLLTGLIASITLSGWYVARHIFFLIRREERVEAALRKNSVELAAANKELEAFSYSVSHDLRTPLRAIDGFSHILLEDYNDKLDEEGKRLLNVVRDNTSRMGQLIDDILQFSRAGRLEMNFHEIDMDSMAREVYEELRPAAGHEPHVEIARLPSAMGDRAMMRQVWVNLLSNAIKFTSVTEGARIEVSGFVEGDETVYVVKDNGAGFDMQYVGNLFGVFQRLHGVNEFEGTGIGLAMVKRIVNRHGGRVWAEGKINEGATFYFALPN